MSKYLIRQVNKFRTDSEMEANQLVSDFKSKHNVASHSITRVDKKDESYYIVIVIVNVNSANDPHETFKME